MKRFTATAALAAALLGALLSPASARAEVDWCKNCRMVVPAGAVLPGR